MKKDISIFLFSLFALSTAFARVAHHPELKKGLEGLERWADSSNALIYFEYRETPLDGFPFATDPHCRQTDAQGVREKLEAHMDFWDRVRTPSFLLSMWPRRNQRSMLYGQRIPTFTVSSVFLL